ncbi:MAG: thymidine phosphorylase [Bacilli bacterium]|nr:thymidine phosphorylase [Bacilli bacterium]
MLNYKIVDPHNTYIEEGVVLGEGVIIFPNVSIVGRTVIGDNTIIDSNSMIKNSIIGEDNYISNSIIEDNNIIGDNNRIGPYAHIREDNVIGSDNHFGNSVEIKKSQIGNSNYFKHFSYIGDAIIGNNVNVGAGVVFANYNSKKNTKETSNVEDGASIGANSVIVAPVVIEKDSVIGAGTVVDKKVSSDSLILARRDNIYKEKYYSKNKKLPKFLKGDILLKKQRGEELSYEELDYVFNGYMNKEVADYQMSSLLMAICINGMSDEEVINLTDIFIKSGEVLNFDDVEGIKVDKHATGGIGDKATLIVTPIVASLGIPVIKISGRGLGYTGGTVDKLNSIPGMNLKLSKDEIRKQVEKVGLVICSQSDSLVPMDKVIYALRDVSGTANSIPLIAVSIMSKKIAMGADKILIDIEVGEGALIKTLDDAKELARLMVKIGGKYGKEVKTIISDMNTPRGYCIGNNLEVIEAMNVLQNKEHNKLSDLCVEIASHIVVMAKNISYSVARNEVLQVIRSGKAYNKFLEFVEAQGGDLSKLKIDSKRIDVKSDKDGIITNISALEIGKLSVMLGAGRLTKEDSIDYSAGIKLNKLTGEYIKANEILCSIYTKKDVDLNILRKIFTIE